VILIWILGATIIVSSISLVGVLTLAINRNLLDRLLILFVGFAAGGLIGGAFLHLLPEALTSSQNEGVFLYTLVGFTFFFLMERYLYWRHCHDGVCDIHTFTYLNLWGDGFHNFVDGLVIAASFLTNIKLGIVATGAIILHEIPQEIGDFGILVYGGFSRTKALFFNFLCGLIALLGASVGYFLTHYIHDFAAFLIPFTAGGFIYIASSDLIPELHRQQDTRRANLSFLLFLMGLILMYLFKIMD
jgi:zinc and cadmium transporter